MKRIFENETFTVDADSAANIYRVINKQTEILEETTSSMYEAMWYAINQHAMLNEVELRADTSWKPAAKKRVTN